MKSSFIILFLVPPATKNPMRKQVKVIAKIAMRGNRSVDSFKVKKNEAIERPIKPRTTKSPMIAPIVLPFAP